MTNDTNGLSNLPVLIQNKVKKNENVFDNESKSGQYNFYFLK